MYSASIKVLFQSMFRLFNAKSVFYELLFYHVRGRILYKYHNNKMMLVVNISTAFNVLVFLLNGKDIQTTEEFFLQN